MSLRDHPIIRHRLDGQAIWYKFPKPYWSRQLQKYSRQCLPILNPFRLKFLECVSEILKAQENWCAVKEHYSQHHSLVLICLVCHDGPWANTWQFFCLTMECKGPQPVQNIIGLSPLDQLGYGDLSVYSLMVSEAPKP